MKLLTSIITAGLLTLSVNANAHTNEKLVAKNFDATTDVCMAVASNKPLKLLKTLRANRLSVKRANRGIKCNGMSLVAFGEKYGATRNIARLTKKISTKTELYSSL